MKIPKLKESIEDTIRRIIYSQPNWSNTTKLREIKEPLCHDGDLYEIYDEAGKEVEARIIYHDNDEGEGQKWYRVDDDYCFDEINPDEYITPKIRQEIEVEKLKKQIDHIVKDVSTEDQEILKDIMSKLSRIDYDLGYGDGHEEGGVDRGYDNGYEDGQKEGYAAGLHAGKLAQEEEEFANQS